MPRGDARHCTRWRSSLKGVPGVASRRYRARQAEGGLDGTGNVLEGEDADHLLGGAEDGEGGDSVLPHEDGRLHHFGALETEEDIRRDDVGDSNGSGATSDRGNARSDLPAADQADQEPVLANG